MKINKLLSGISLGFLAIAAGGFAHAQTLLLDVTFDASNTGTTNEGTVLGTTSFTNGAGLSAAGDGLLGGSSTALDLTNNVMGTTAGGSLNQSAVFNPTTTQSGYESFTYVIWYDSTGGQIGNKARLFDSGENDDNGNPEITFRGSANNNDTTNGVVSLAAGNGGSSGGLQTTNGATPNFTNGSGVWTFAAVTYTQNAAATAGTTTFWTGTNNGSGITEIGSPISGVLGNNVGTLGALLLNSGGPDGFYIGNREDGQRGFEGYLTDMELYGDTSDANGALTSTQLTAVYDADLGIGAVPEPSTLALVAAGAIGLLFVAKRRPLGSRS